MTYRTLKVTDFDRETFDWTTKITDDEIAFIIADADKIVYVWNGQKASNVRKYKGGTLATKIKSLYQLYGFKTSTVNQGEEVGALKAEIENLLGGKGAAPVEEEARTPSKAGPSVAERTAARPTPAIVRATPAARVDKAEIPTTAESRTDKRVQELETELENEKKKSTHRYTKLKEEMEETKGKYEKRITELNAEIAAARKGTITLDQHNAEVKQLTGEKDSLNVLVEGLKKELEQREAEAKGGSEADKKVEALQVELDGLKGVKEKLANAEKITSSLEKKNADLTGTISSLQAEITVLKAKAESAEGKKATPGEIEDLKQQVESLQKSLDQERKKSKDAQDKAAEYEEKLKKLENKAASAKEESQVAQRKLIEQKEAAKQMDGLDFAPLDEDEAKPAAGGASLAFVTPYSGGELGGEIDPLTDLKSFLNTVDPSKPLDPELKSLLDIVSKKIEDDAEILGDLQKIKKKVKDKKLESLLDDAIKNIKNVSK